MSNLEKKGIGDGSSCNHVTEVGGPLGLWDWH